ncbi:MAG: aminotransferase class IV [Arenicellales bacterium]|jgi:branched-chain amino acid aminotransferase|nr:aminotransferase class IV [Arenicellales bacterium]MDP6948653.1 aminotransferase class IV [Arenicellales bacterium]
MTDTGGYPPGAAFIDGAFVPMSEANISVLDWGFLRSDATYDVVHVWRNRFFRIDAHIDRFFDSMAGIRLECGYSREQVRAVLAECVRKSGLEAAFVEMICTRGISPDFSRDPREAINRFIAFAVPFSWILRPEDREHGIHLAVSSIHRIPQDSVNPRVKNYHWLDLVMGLFEAFDRGAANVVLTDAADHVVEGPGFNIFAVINGSANTPASGVLHGITRRTAIELLAEAGITTLARPLAVSELINADEVFITSTAGGVISVTRIDERPVADGNMGPVTRQLTDLYWQAHERPQWSLAIDDIPAPAL